ncbi:MAG: excinuclease ABC subunit UvrC [Rhodanobacteraceae bacterium]|nr:excinuclease ABC subunit UvrC [Rhodanobacteraceae bacterium]
MGRSKSPETGEAGEAGENSREFDGKAFVRRLSDAPGVYRMLSDSGDILYVGKASSLKKRVGSYFSGRPHNLRISRMIAQIAGIEVTVTRSEREALLLEDRLIKTHQPRYNVLLRDDKSFPYIRVTHPDTYPRLAFHRGSRSAPGRYFGPYPGAGPVREALNLLHRLFQLRSCEDSVFANRSRPCLQYQIKRCSAPCVALIGESDYAASVHRAELFLDGRNTTLIDELTADMHVASERQDYEEAARLRDLVVALRGLTSRQYVEGEGGDLDALACVLREGRACVMLLAVRGGRSLGTRSFFPKTNGAEDAAEVLAAFLSQYYLSQPPPREILIDRELEDVDTLAEVLRETAGHKVAIRHSVRGERARHLETARHNAELALASDLGSREAQEARVNALTALLELEQPPQRVECFDISHTAGEATVASCVVFDVEGPVKSQYRRYNISGITPGDDYAAMHQALTRRFRHAQDEGAVLPDLLLIDGGPGQLKQAQAVLSELGVVGVPMLGVAKAEGRRPGHETLVLDDGRRLRPGPDSPAIHLIQQVRDEAHRFAISGHRGRRAKQRRHSVLEDIEGIGSRRRTSLLRHFGGLSGLRAAGIEDIAAVEGISRKLAERIYATLHDSPTA